ncbi:MAG: Crp/Fnr family transcriptional regulator [Acidimicrobiia bacterium]
MAALRRHSDKTDLLKQVPLFANLSPKQLTEVARHTDEIKKEAGSVLAEQGDLGNEMFIIVSGSATITRDGQKLASRGDGDFVGEMSLLDGQPRSATVTVEEDSVLLVMHRSDFSQLLDDVPGLARKILQGLSQRLRETDAMLLD